MEQLSMFTPNSNWRPPEEWPDFTNAKAISLDCETRDPHLLERGPGGVRYDGQVVGVSLSDGTQTVYLPVAHEGGDNLDKVQVFKYLEAQLKGNQPKIGANLIYDLEWLRAEGIPVAGDIWDIQIAEPLIDENQSSYSLSALAKKYLGEDKDESLLRQAAAAYGVDPKGGLWRLPARYVGPYAEADAALPIRIWEQQKRILHQEDLWEIFELESALVPIMLDMRFRGVRVDVDRAEQINDQCLRDEARLLGELRDLVGYVIDPWSSDDLGKAFDKLKIWFPRTGKGNPSFTGDWLQGHEHPIAKKIAEYRKLNKMRRDFVEGMVLKMEHSGRIHCQFHALRKDEDGTRSGRFSSSQPNLQQVPARDEYWGPLIRGLFLPDEGMEWASCDYSQQEPRVLVHYADLLGLKGAAEAVQQYTGDTDFHQMVADMAGIKRKQAKTINLGMFYGMGIYKLSQELGVSIEEAKPLFEQYHDRVPFVRQLSQRCSQSVSEKGWIKTLLGRKRHFNLWEPADSKNTWPNRENPLTLDQAQKVWADRPLRRSMVHKSLNALIQGGSADMTKKAMIDLYKEGELAHIQVHDELCFSVRDRKHGEKIKDIMENCVKINVPIKVDLEMGPTWGESK
jgi:DNA polymerase I-like protein with 3'-5' exonuclease and polymerase domains